MGAGQAHRVTVLLVPQELVSKLLHLHFKDDKTRGVDTSLGVGMVGGGGSRPWPGLWVWARR